MLTQSAALSLATLQPEIDRAFAEWEVYKQGQSERLTPSQLRVVNLARLIIGRQEQIFRGVTGEHPLSAEQETAFYKIFSRAAKVHFGCSENLFSASDRLLIVQLLLKFAPSKMRGDYKHPLTLLKRFRSEIVVNRLGWHLLLGSHFVESLLHRGKEPADPLFFDFGDQEHEARMACRSLSATVALKQGASSLRGADLICLQTTRQLALFSMYMGIEGQLWYTSIDPMAEVLPTQTVAIRSIYRDGMSQLQMATAALDKELTGDRIWSDCSCPFVVSLPLKEFLPLLDEASPEGDCVRAAVNAHRMVLEEDLSNFEAYLLVVQNITASHVAAGVRIRKGRFVVSEMCKGLALPGIEHFSDVDGPVNRALYDAARRAIEEYDRIQILPSGKALERLECVTVSRQLIRILFPFLENSALECPLLVCQDKRRLYALIERAIRAELYSQEPFFTDYERDWLRRILNRFCPDLMACEADSVRIESSRGFVLINKNLLMLFFRDYSLEVIRSEPYPAFKTIYTEGLLEDGLRALAEYFQWGDGNFQLTSRQALQVFSFFKKMSCKTFCSKSSLLEMILDKMNLLCEDGEIFNNQLLAGDLLTIACAALQKLRDEVKKSQKAQAAIYGFFRRYSGEEEKKEAGEAAVQEFLNRGN